MRNVRNFWATADVDGRASMVRIGGPAASDGGMSLSLKVRDGGTVVNALSVLCRAIESESGTVLRVTVIDERSGETVARIETKR